MTRRAHLGFARGLTALALAGLTLGLAGCWDTPPREWYAPPDMGLDEGTPDGSCDAGCCDGGTCSAPDIGPPRPRELRCDDGADNDGDGLVDCADFDCADHASCCAEGALLFQEDWTGADLTFLWDHLPSSEPTASPNRETDGDTTMLAGYDDTATHTLAYHRCLPMALGAELTFEAIATSRDFVCERWYEPCDRQASVILSTVDDTLPGQALLDDLAIRVHADFRLAFSQQSPIVINQSVVRVTQGGMELGSVPIDPEVRYRIALRVTPSVHAGVASLRADVEVQRVGAPEGEPPATLGGFFLASQEALVRGASGCLEVGGLYTAVEMVERGARIGPLRAETLTCANPSQFQAAPDGTTTLTSESLGVPASYGGAHIGAPTLGSSFNNASDPAPRWDLFFEATNDPPELALVAHVGYAIAHTRSGTFGAQPSDWTTSSTPRLGDDPPSCLVSGGTCSEPSVRDPFLLVRRGGGDLLQDFTLAFAQRRPEGGHELRVEEDVSFSPNTLLGGAGVAVVLPSSACADLRDPALVRVSGGTEGFWLFFTCVPPGRPSELHALRLDNDFTVRSGAVPERVVAPADVGALGVGGVFGAEPIVLSAPSGLTLQLWFVARDAAGNTSLVLMTGQVPASETPDGGVPTAPALEALPLLSPYLANPVLRAGDPVLGGCPGLCRITGAAVSDTAGDPNELRFLVARRVFLPGGEAFSEMVPLTQTWRAP